MTDPILRVEAISKRFGGVVVADEVSVTLAAGEVVGLIGPNGAGKTSLLNLITGIVPVDAGQIFFGGVPIHARKVDERSRRGIARTWQQARPFASLSVLDNLIVSARGYPGESLVASIFRAGAVRRRRARCAIRRWPCWSGWASPPMRRSHRPPCRTGSRNWSASPVR